MGPDHPSVALVLGNLTGTLASIGRYDEAKAAGRRALEIDESGLGPEHPRVAWSLGALGGRALRRARCDDAERLLARALELLCAKAGAPPTEIARIERDLARTALVQGRVDIAAEPARGRGGTCRKRPGEPHAPLGVGGPRRRVDPARRSPGRGRVVRALDEKLSGPEHPELAETLVGLATVRLREGNAAAASELCRRALAIAERAYGAAHPDAGRA